VRTYRLEEAHQALQDLREGRLSGAAVLVPEAEDREREELLASDNPET
jgi:hypothetical protein